MYMLESIRFTQFWHVVTFGTKLCLSDMPTFFARAELTLLENRYTIAYTWKQEIKNFLLIQGTKLRDVFFGKDKESKFYYLHDHLNKYNQNGTCLTTNLFSII